MPIERLASLLGAVALIAALLIGGVALPAAWDRAAHFAAFSLITCLLWHASGAAPVQPALVALLAGAHAWGIPGADAAAFLAALGGVLATTGVLLMQRRLRCAESSPR